ncbi:MAG TPA: class I SAM-dependent methyltransferase [Candidatus Nanopelagicales bacterium]|nr:class I SAM-dependent methyltransferase [Candidatus Nanopelagicales bacterium]
MSEAVRQYLDSLENVDGWLQPGAAQLICDIDARQQQRGTSGARVEFGVHHGRSLILLALLDPDSPVLGLDLDDAHVRPHIESYGLTNASMVMGNTNDIDATRIRTELAALGASSVRMVSIDGDHTYEGTLHDLLTTAELLCAGGVAIVDDVANPIYPGVHEAMVELIDTERLVPFAAAGGRIAMCSPADIADWADALSGYAVVDVRGWPVVMTTDDAWRQPTLETRALAEGVSMDEIMIPARREYAQQLVARFAGGKVTDGASLDHWIGEFLRDTGLTREELGVIAREVLGDEGLENLKRKWGYEEASA